MIANKKGFTIIEMVFVLAVISIIAAFTIPSISSKIVIPDLSSDKRVINNMNEALLIDEKINGRPSSLTEVNLAIGNSSIDIDDVDCLKSNYRLYWYTKSNVVVLVNTNNNKVVYPLDYTNIDFESENEYLFYYSK